MELKYTIDETAQKPIMLINDTIGKEGINGADFQRELLYLDSLGKECIEIWINSPGGSVIDGFSIASAMINAKTPIKTKNMGIAGSIAGVIFMSAKNREMMDFALLMVHNVSGGANDTAREELNNSISMLLANNSDLTQEQLRALMENETWMNADYSKENGFATFIQNSAEVVFNLENAYEDVFDYANNIINEINMKKEKIENQTEEEKKAALVEEQENSAEVIVVSTESEEEEELEETEEEMGENEIKSSESEEDVKKGKKLKSASQAMEEQPTNSVEDFQNLVNEKDAMIAQLQKEIATLKATEQEKEITNFINEYLEIGKISNETKDSWFNLCKSDFESTKEVIKSLNINKEAPRFENNSNSEKSPASFRDFLTFGKGKNK